MQNEKRKSLLSEELWPKSCPTCGESHTESGTWYNPEPYKPYTNSDEIMLAGQCWNCNTMHPWFAIAHRLMADNTKGR